MQNIEHPYVNMLQCNSCTCNDPKYYVLLGDKAIELMLTIKLFRVSNLTEF